MTRRIEAGPVIVALGAVVLLVSAWLDWYGPGLSAWTTFESLDLVVTGLALAGLAAAAGLLSPGLATLDRRWMAPLAGLAFVVVASQLIDPPPAAGPGELLAGAWIAFVAATGMLAGALISFSRVRLAFTVEERDPRHRMTAVDARRPVAADEDGAAGNGHAPEHAGATTAADER